MLKDNLINNMLKISHQQIEWSQSDTLIKQLPYTFENGMQFHGFTAKCSGCLNKIESKNLRGSVARLDTNRCLLNAKGYCQPCNGITSYSYILTAAEELRAEVFDADNTPGDGAMN